MAGSNPQNKSSLPKPPPPPSSSSSHRKSRWESSATPNNKKSPPSDPKPGESNNPKKPSNPTTNPSPKTKPNPSPSHPKHQSVGPTIPNLGPPPPPAYGFHMLERRTIVLADGSVRSYFALPPDYPLDPPPPGRLFPPPPPPPLGPGFDPGRFGARFGPVPPQDRGGRERDYWDSVGIDFDGRVEGSLGKRKFGGGDEVERDGFARQRKQLLHDANANPNGFPLSGPFKHDLMDPELRGSKFMRVGGGFESVGFRQPGGGDSDSVSVVLKHLEVDQGALKKAFLHFVKLVNENASHKRNYLDDGKHGRIQCVACGRFDMCGYANVCLFVCKFVCFDTVRKSCMATQLPSVLMFRLILNVQAPYSFHPSRIYAE